MKKIIDLQTFQKITTDCMKVHQMVRSTESLTAEAERIFQLADSLLREAGLAYLNGGQNLDLPSLPNSEQVTPPQEVVENFIRVQHALAELKQALYQLMKIYVAEKRWPELATSANALIYLGENKADFSDIVKAIEDTFIPQAEGIINVFAWGRRAVLKQSEWDKARTLLKPWLFSPKVRSCYYSSYVDQSCSYQNDYRPLCELRSQLPKSHLPRLDYFLNNTYLLSDPIYDENDFEYEKRVLEYDHCYADIRSEVNEIVMDPNFKPRQVL